MATFLRKERAVTLVAIVGVCGILLIYLSSFFGGTEAVPEEETASSSGFLTYKEELEADLRRVVTAITRETTPTVVVTLENNGRNLYASDERYTVEQPGGEGETSREERETAHILLEDAQGNQSALTITQTQPEVQGVVVVSQFAGNAPIREKLLEAVCTALHVSSAKVCVTAGG